MDFTTNPKDKEIADAVRENAETKATKALQEGIDAAKKNVADEEKKKD